MNTLVYKLEALACKLERRGYMVHAANVLAAATVIQTFGEAMGIEANIIANLSNRAATAESQAATLSASNASLAAANTDLQGQLAAVQANAKDAADLEAESHFNPDGTPKADASPQEPAAPPAA